MRTLSGVVLAALMALTRQIGFTASQQPAGANLPTFGYSIVRTYPHDPKAFTQGLQYADGALYEGTGEHGKSSIRRVKLETGEVLQKQEIPAEHFGEGIVLFNNELFQLTWQTHAAFVYDKNTFARKKQFSYPGEGWGLTTDGTNLIMSDGTNQLRVLDPATFVEKRRLAVSAAGVPVRQLNELEYVKGEIFANVWMTDYIARITADTGQVSGYIDLRGLLTPAQREKTDVLNGIAYDAAGDRLFVTGKWWPKVFEIRLVKK